MFDPNRAPTEEGETDMRKRGILKAERIPSTIEIDDGMEQVDITAAEELDRMIQAIESDGGKVVE